MDSPMFKRSSSDIWFSPGTPASSTTKTGRHVIAEILLKVALNTKKLIKSINHLTMIMISLQTSKTRNPQ